MRIIVGISGASGTILGIELLKALRLYPQCETHLVITEGAKKTLSYETNIKVEEIVALADHCYDINNMGASISSGSFKTDGMVIIPCSMKTLSGVAYGFTDNLLIRAADVCLKEDRRLILVPREFPLSSIHLENMARAANHGCTIMPPVLTFYNNPKTIQDMINHLIGKILMLFSLEFNSFIPWEGAE
jgi:4-hydroxy-3-polyprenylbenzoate decarboxylase